MPTYEYACSSCGTHVEVYQRFSDDPLTECGVCGGPLRKVFHPAGILFKGSGFYVTDSRAGASKRSGGDGESTGSKSDKGADSRSGSGSKTAKKAESGSSGGGSSGGDSASGGSKEKSA